MPLSAEVLALPAVILLSLAAVTLLVSRDWRISISALGLLYVGVFILVLLSWPMEMAVVKLVAGWISASVLGLGLVNYGAQLSLLGRYWPSEIVFRISAAGLVVLATISLVPGILKWLPEVNSTQAFGGLLLIGMGVLHLGFTLQPLQTVMGLLTFYAGFEILYSTVESSVLVAGFLAVINLGVALVGAYLLSAPTLELEE
jgi:hypothetical protein